MPAPDIVGVAHPPASNVFGGGLFYAWGTIKRGNLPAGYDVDHVECTVTPLDGGSVSSLKPLSAPGSPQNNWAFEFVVMKDKQYSLTFKAVLKKPAAPDMDSQEVTVAPVTAKRKTR